MNESDVSELAARARAGDRRAFELLVRRLVRPALAAAWEFVPTREDAEEFVQDAFARCWKEFGRYDQARPFAPWFFCHRPERRALRTMPVLVESSASHGSRASTSRSEHDAVTS